MKEREKKNAAIGMRGMSCFGCVGDKTFSNSQMGGIFTPAFDPSSLSPPPFLNNYLQQQPPYIIYISIVMEKHRLFEKTKRLNTSS